MSIHEAEQWLEAVDDGFTPAPAPYDPDRLYELADEDDRRRDMEAIRSYVGE